MAEVIDVQAKPKKSKKKYFIIAGIIAFIMMMVAANNHAKQKEAGDASSVDLSVLEQTPQSTNSTAELSESELKQQALIKIWGEPPAGFRWTDKGNLVAVSDEGLTAEETVYQYLRALSTLNMETAQKYAYYSRVLGAYDSYYTLDASDSYYTQFARQVLTQSLLSMEVEEVESEAIFASGRRIFTVRVTVLDLGYKDWWLTDADEIFNTLYQYMTSEQDSTKAQQYIYEKVLEYFKTEDAARKTTTVDIVLDKVSLGGWLVSDDTALDMLCEYTDGTSVYEYIMKEYAKWVQAKGAALQ